MFVSTTCKCEPLLPEGYHSVSANVKLIPMTGHGSIDPKVTCYTPDKMDKYQRCAENKKRETPIVRPAREKKDEDTKRKKMRVGRILVRQMRAG